MKKSPRLAWPLPKGKTDDELIRTVLAGNSAFQRATNRQIRSLRGMESLVSCLLAPPPSPKRH